MEIDNGMFQNASKEKQKKRQNKYKNILFKETGIHSSIKPTKYLMVGNAGLVTGLQQEQLLGLGLQYGQVNSVVMLAGKSYSFIAFEDVISASKIYDALHGKVELTLNNTGPIYLVFTENVPATSNMWEANLKPQGLILLEDFVTENEEQILLDCIDWESTDPHLVDTGGSLKHRKVKHYGYEFRYNTNNVDKDCPLEQTVPAECKLLWSHLIGKIPSLSFDPEQLTVNQYQPGQGIPSHVDTHSAFDDPILSLSLGSAVVMEFKHGAGNTVPILLPRRSLLIMSGEARYVWSHGITPRKTDVVPSQGGGLTVQNRGVRTSFTFRRIREGECRCSHHDQCDSYRRNNGANVVGDDGTAAQLEAMHVHQVYEEIANHFSETRHKPWPNVVRFIQALPTGSMLLDVGCGNGKYFSLHSNTFQIGCDHSLGLARVCKERGFQVLNCNCLSLPLRSNVADGCISIAVVHHLATHERRLLAVEEMIRVLQPGGKALIYVWAKDQERHRKKSSYLKQDKKNRKEEGSGDGKASAEPIKPVQIPHDSGLHASTEDQPSLSLPVHVNRTQFQHQDLLVPWKLKPGGKDLQREEQESTSGVPTFYRYYHVFEEGELEELCSMAKDASVIESYYDQGNWCIILQKR